MGILNVTPDSFTDGGRYVDHTLALQYAKEMLDSGASIIDVGGESTRPGAKLISAAEELERVLPVVQALVLHGALVSIDTSKATVMTACCRAGAQLINDVRALREPGALAAAAASEATICLMHLKGDPSTMQNAPYYTNVSDEVIDFLRTRIAACVHAGINRERLLVDPGFGFGKSLQHNLTLLRELSSLEVLGLPLVVGLSRKSMLAALTGRGVEERLAGSLALALASLEGGARIIRTHDVAETVDALKVWAAFRGG